MAQAHIQIHRVNGTTAEIFISMAEEDFKEFEEMAQKRGVALAEMFAEALRLERIFVNSRAGEEETLYLSTKGGELRELVAV